MVLGNTHTHSASSNMQEAENLQGLKAASLEAEPEPVVSPSGTLLAASSTIKLHDSFKKCLDYGLSTPNLQDFQSNFPGLAPAVVEALYDTYQQMLALVRFNCQAEFQDICKEYGVEQFLGALDHCAASHASGNRTSQSRLGDPAAAVQSCEAAARTHVLQEEADRLQNLLERATNQQERLRDALALRQGHVDKLLNIYTSTVTDVKQVYDVAKTWPSAHVID